MNNTFKFFNLSNAVNMFDIIFSTVTTMEVEAFTCSLVIAAFTLTNNIFNQVNVGQD